MSKFQAAKKFRIISNCAWSPPMQMNSTTDAYWLKGRILTVIRNMFYYVYV